MKNILTKIKIHPLTYLVILVAFITGMFKDLFVFMSIILFHELGHILGATIFRWKIDKIVIMPFGGMTIFDELVNKKIYEELIILIMGPLFQFVLFISLKDITPSFNYYNYGLFIFNFLPIYPLDGYKAFYLLFCLFMPYKYVLKIMIFISLLFILLTFKMKFIYIVINILLLIGVIKEYKKINYIYNKFLWERYNYKIAFRRIKRISNINCMYRDCTHFIKSKDRWISEYEMLKKIFHH